MKYTLFDKVTRQVLGCGEVTNEESIQPNGAVVLKEVMHTASGWLDENDQFVPQPPQPSLYHQFNWVTKEWEDARPFEMVLRVKLRDLDIERQRRTGEVMEYRGRKVDADARAQGNITAKLNEIQAREATNTPMPAEHLIWMDADNQLATFNTQTEMKEWLQGLMVKIPQRGTEAYAWSWGMKEIVRQAKTVKELDAITW